MLPAMLRRLRVGVDAEGPKRRRKWFLTVSALTWSSAGDLLVGAALLREPSTSPCRG